MTANPSMESGKSVVYFTPDISPNGLTSAYEALGREPSGKVAVKLSTGERRRRGALSVYKRNEPPLNRLRL